MGELIISQLLYYTKLVINGLPHRLTEIELYYYSPEHPDTFTHRTSEQSTSGVWYFHRAGVNGKYKGGTFKGLDISLGNGSDSYGGILIRGLQNLQTGEIIKGPCRVVDYILRVTNYSNIESLVTQGLGGRDNMYITHPLLCLKSTSEPVTNISPTTKKRVGLTLKRPDEHKPHFIDREYNFSTYK